MTKINQLISIAERITENECTNTQEYLYGRSYIPVIETIRELYERDGVRWSPLVEHDVNQVLSGSSPDYFLSDFAFADLYRERRSICLVEPVARFVPGWETAELTRKYLACIQKQHELLGVSLWQYGRGYACFAEAKSFYESAEWQNKAKAVRYM